MMLIKVKVTPNAKKARIIKYSPDLYRIYVQEPAEDGKANKAVIELIADEFSVAKSKVRITHGLKSKEKTISIAKED